LNLALAHESLQATSWRAGPRCCSGEFGEALKNHRDILLHGAKIILVAIGQLLDLSLEVILQAKDQRLESLLDDTNAETPTRSLGTQDSNTRKLPM
jgi:hypothetical protein